MITPHHRAVLEDQKIAGMDLTVTMGGREKRPYKLSSWKASGKAGITWEVTDWNNRSFAAKFVLRTEYKDHSLEQEAHHVSLLTTSHVANIEFYGEPHIAGLDTLLEEFYVILVEWINGVTLKEFLEAASPDVDISTVLRFSQNICEALQDLRDNALCHNDLHADNIMIRPTRNILTDDTTMDFVIIDTGSLKTEARRLSLLEYWRQELQTLEKVSAEGAPTHADYADRLRSWIEWFKRTDQEWFTRHLCSLHNTCLLRMETLEPRQRQFLLHLPMIVDRFIDPDLSRREDVPREMYKLIEATWETSAKLMYPTMSSPFDFMSAELIRSDAQLMELFSDQSPGLSQCRGSDPIYLYGPRGCGKSTVLRSLSIRALLASDATMEEVRELPFIGVYISCSSELRSRFWLMTNEDYSVLEGHIIKYFNYLLIEALLGTLDLMYSWDKNREKWPFGLGQAESSRICNRIVERLGLDVGPLIQGNESHFSILRSQLGRVRDALWKRILDRDEPKMRADAQVIFDVCSMLGEESTLFQERPIAFLLDDYSNQRIPRQLQQRLNQAISFAKQGNPIFKVASEYDGVDLTGIQEGREVRQINVGHEYVRLTGSTRYLFLLNLIEKRFASVGHPIKLLDVLPCSEIGPCIPMATRIREAHRGGERFYYHGIDTISDLCSGDYAMGLELIRAIFEAAGVHWAKPTRIAPNIQHAAIERYATREHEYIKYLAPGGREKYELMDRLCWLARESVLARETTKDGKAVPEVKIHLDIGETAINTLGRSNPDLWERFHDLIRRGILFPLKASKSREGHDGTQRYQIRRILLPRYGAPLGRYTAIKIDTEQNLTWLLTDPKKYVEAQLKHQAPSMFEE